jgi:hypothetical protein
VCSVCRLQSSAGGLQAWKGSRLSRTSAHLSLPGVVLQPTSVCTQKKGRNTRLVGGKPSSFIEVERLRMASPCGATWPRLLIGAEGGHRGLQTPPFCVVYGWLQLVSCRPHFGRRELGCNQDTQRRGLPRQGSRCTPFVTLIFASGSFCCAELRVSATHCSCTGQAETQLAVHF